MALKRVKRCYIGYMRYTMICFALLLAACVVELTDQPSSVATTEYSYYTPSSCDWYAAAHQPNLDYPSYCEEWPRATCCTWYGRYGCADEWCYSYDSCAWEYSYSDC
jgi:hypothetical protein